MQFEESSESSLFASPQTCDVVSEPVLELDWLRDVDGVTVIDNVGVEEPVELRVRVTEVVLVRVIEPVWLRDET